MGIQGSQDNSQGRTLTLGGAIPTPAPTPAPAPAPAPQAPMLQLNKGDALVLVKASGNIENVEFGGGWMPNPMPGQTWDIDLTAIVLDANGKSRMGKFVCFDARYRQTEEGAIKHNGDNTVGKSQGVAESISAFLTRLSPADQRIKLFVHIFDGQRKGQHFGLIQNAFIQLEDPNTKENFARYNLQNEYSGYTAVELGELVRNGTAWQFNATGIGLNEECAETISRFL